MIQNHRCTILTQTDCFRGTWHTIQVYFQKFIFESALLVFATFQTIITKIIK